MKPISDKDFIPPFICKTFKIVPNGISENDSVILDYVDTLSESQLSQIKTMTRKAVKLGEKLERDQLDRKIAKMFSDDHPDVTPNEAPSNEPKNDGPPNPQIKYQSDVLGAEDFIKTLPLPVLEREIKRRYLSKPVSGVITINDSGTKVSMPNMPWPQGSYEFEMKFVSEIPQTQENTTSSGANGENNG